MLKFALIGGSTGGIALSHLAGATHDGLAKLSCGCFSRNQEKNKTAGDFFGLAGAHVYESYEALAASDEDIDFVVITTPNMSHYPIAKAFLSRGIHVVCDKPFTVTSSQAAELIAIAEEKDLLTAITYTYTAFPMIQLAKALVEEGKIGNIFMVNGSYTRSSRLKMLSQGADISKIWRLDPSQSGISGSTADIGTHVENITSFVSGLSIHSVCANLMCVPGDPKLDTNASILLKYKNGAGGLFWASQVIAGSNNGIQFKLCGDRGGLAWDMQDPEQLWFYPLEGEAVLYRRFSCDHAVLKRFTRKSHALNPSIEGFANIYRDFCQALLAKKAGESYQVLYPTAIDGLRGVRFVEACVESSQKDSERVLF